MRLTSGRQIIFIALVLVVMLLLTGCNALNTLSTIKARFNSEPESAEPPVISIPELPIPTPVDNTIPSELKEVVLYFADGYGQSLVAEHRLIPKEEGIARATINELLAGPDLISGFLPTVPYGTVLKDINVKDDGLIIVDFSKELVENHVGGDLGEALTVFSIVNTLAQFPTVDRVQFLVEGQLVETIAGSVNIFDAVYPDDSLVIGENFDFD
ncbi:MAG: GerMN domain-containing protein [Bacillota bacterium]